MEHVQLGRVEEQPGLLVEHEGVVLPGVPQPLRHLDELGGALDSARRAATCAAWLKLSASEAADEVTTFQPMRPPLMLVERREHPRHMERIEIGRGRGRDQPDPAR